MREEGGRPSPGMRPRVLDTAGRELAPALTVLLIPKEPEESTAFFRFQVMKTQDPRDVYERALVYLQADYFQSPKTFSDRLVMVLPRLLARRIADRCRRLHLRVRPVPAALPHPLQVRELKPGNAAREAAIWHNRVFNPALPDTVQVIGFKPDWALPGPIQSRSAERHAPARTSDTPCSAASEDDAATFGNARATHAPACRDPADCRATSSTSECAPSH